MPFVTEPMSVENDPALRGDVAVHLRPAVPVEVEEGETLDFVVDCLANESYDSFGWAPTIELVSTDGKATMRYEAAVDFRGPQPLPQKLTVLEQYAQALMLTNEFLFVD